MLKQKNSSVTVPMGKSIRCGSFRSTWMLPFSNIIRPRLGTGGCTPMPIQLNTSSEPATPASPADMDTISGLSMLGRMCARSTRAVDAPVTSAASVYWLSRACNACPRTSRAMPNHPNMDSATAMMA